MDGNASIVQHGEHAYNISNEFKEKYNNVPWSMMAGLRHRLVHDYDGTNWNIIVEVIYDDLPVLIEQLREIIGQENENAAQYKNAKYLKN